MRVLAVVPARGGSKGVPRKNLLPIGGVPLIGRTVRVLKHSPSVTDVVVTTDDPEIAEVARAYGAEIVDRPAELAGDAASSESAVLHACTVWRTRSSAPYDMILLAQNTSPFHSVRDVEAVIETVSSGRSRSCITVTETYRYFWARTDEGWMMPYQTRANRQNRRCWYMEAGSLYCVLYDSFVRDGKLFAVPVGAHVIPEWRALEIDEPADVVLAECLCRARPAEESGLEL